jgi:hypothetical protein
MSTQTSYERKITVLEDGPTGVFGGGNQGDPAQRTVGGYEATGSVGAASDDLNDRTVKELQVEAKALGLTGLSKASKDELVAAIEAAYADQDNTPEVETPETEENGEPSGDGDDAE